MRHIAFGSVTHMKFPLVSSKDATGQLIVSGHPQVSLTQQTKKKTTTKIVWGFKAQTVIFPSYLLSLPL